MSENVENTATPEAAVNEKVESSNEAKWYVAHTYSGYENKVKSDIEKTIENRKLQDQILEVAVPVQDVVEMKNGVKKTVSRKLFPGYVLLNMYMNDVTWYIVRNTRGVTGFVGPESKPVPLTEAEMRTLGINVNEVSIDAEVGDMIKVVTGAWEGNSGEIKAINEGKQTVTIEVDIFGRATSVEIGFADIQKM
jgi:transcriptional antiterminator NusG